MSINNSFPIISIRNHNTKVFVSSNLTSKRLHAACFRGYKLMPLVSCLIELIFLYFGTCVALLVEERDEI